MSAKKLKIWSHAPKDWEKYDLYLKFPIDPETNRLKPEGMIVIRNLVKLLGRRYIYTFFSQDEKHVILLVRTRLKLLRAKAHSESWQLLLDEELCEVMAYAGNNTDLISSFAVSHRPDITPLLPFQHIYAPYISDKSVEHLYRTKFDSRHPFHKTLRLKMVTDFLQQKNISDVELSLDYLQSQGIISNFAAVHDLKDRQKLIDEWLTYLPAILPVDSIKEYFGEKVAYYFAFHDYLFSSLSFLALVGVGFQIPAVTFNRFNRPEIQAFSFFMLAWTIYTFAYWKKEQQMLNLQWNTIGLQLKERLSEHHRYHYYGTRMKSYVDGKETVYFHPLRRYGLYFLSFILIILYLAVMVAIQAAIYYARWQLTDTDAQAYRQWLASIASGLVIILSGKAFYYYADLLSSWENHRTDSDYYESMIVKVTSFQIVHTLLSCYYLAFGAQFVKKHNQSDNSLGECIYGNCMNTLAINVTAIASTLIIWKFFVGYFIPWCVYSCSKSRSGYDGPGQRYNENMAPILGPDTNSQLEAGNMDDYRDELRSPVTSPHSGKNNKPNLRRGFSAMNSGFDEDPLGPFERRTLKGYLNRQESSNFFFDKNSVFPESEFDIVAGSPGHSPKPNQSPKKHMGPSINPLSRNEMSVSSPARDQTRKRLQNLGSTLNTNTSDSVADVYPFTTDSQSVTRERRPSVGSVRSKTESVRVDKGRIYLSSIMETGGVMDMEQGNIDDPVSKEDDELMLTSTSNKPNNLHNSGSQKSGFFRTNSDLRIAPLSSPNSHKYTAGNIDTPLMRTQSSNFQMNIDDALDDDEHMEVVDPFRFPCNNAELRKILCEGYGELLSMLSLALCFGSALPAVYLLLLIYLTLEIRGRGWEFLYVFPRLMPVAVEGLGVLMVVIDALLGLAIVTNATVLIVTMDRFWSWSMAHRLLLWIAFTMVLFVQHFTMHVLYNGIPEEVIIQKQRSRFIVSKLIEKLPDQEDSLPVDIL